MSTPRGFDFRGTFILSRFVDRLSLRKHRASVKRSLSPVFMNVALCKLEEERDTCCAEVVQQETEVRLSSLQ